MNTMMKAEIASERIKSRSHTPKAGRSRAPEFGSAGLGGESGAWLLPGFVLGVSGMRLSYCIQITPSRQWVVRDQPSLVPSGYSSPDRPGRRRVKIDRPGDVMTPSRLLQNKIAYRALTL